MTDISLIQDAFARGLMSEPLVAPACLKAASGSVNHRFDVYRNNVFAGLINVLEARFSAVSRIVGAEFFRGFARQFIEQHPPRSPALVFYGGDFPRYIGSADECADVPYLADVAAIEWELHRCYHAADEVILTAAQLASSGCSPEAITFRLAASAAVVCSSHPAYSIWRANARDTAADPLRIAGQPEATLVSRRGLECEAVLMPAGGGVFFEALGAGRTLSEAAALASHHDPAFRLDQVLGLLLRQNAFAAFHNQND